MCASCRELAKRLERMVEEREDLTLDQLAKVHAKVAELRGEGKVV